MEVTFTVSKWDEKPIDDTRKDFPFNIAHVEYDIDGELKIYTLETSCPHLFISFLTN